MELTNEQLQTLRSLKTLMDSDDIRVKEIIKKSLIDSELIIYLLNNKELQDADADPSDYLGVNILPMYMIHPTQHNVQNYICYEVGFRELERYNSKMKLLQITFYILCEEKNNIEKLTGIARHDLLGALILDMFNWSNIFGQQIHCVSDLPSITDNDYATRTIIFEQLTDNNLAKTRSGVTRIIPRDISATDESSSD